MYRLIEKIGKFHDWGIRSPVGRVVRWTYLFVIVAIGLAAGILVIAAIGAFTPISTALSPITHSLVNLDRRLRWRRLALALLGTCSFAAMMLAIRESYYSLGSPYEGPLSASTLKVVAWGSGAAWLGVSAWIAMRLANWRPQRVRRGYPAVEGFGVAPDISPTPDHPRGP